MKRLPLLVMAGILMVAPLAQAEEYPFVVTDTITAPGPTSKVIGGVTELMNPCGAPDPDLGDLKGVDGVWIELPGDAGGRSATLTSDSIDMDVWFYTDCALINDDADPTAYDMATELTADEAGVIPAGAAFAIVDLALGVNATFTFTIE